MDQSQPKHEKHPSAPTLFWPPPGGLKVVVSNNGRFHLAVLSSDVEKGIDEILRLLGNHNVSATFFWVGDTVRRSPEICRRIGENHEVGCPSLYHENVGSPLFDVPGVQPVLPEETAYRIGLNTEIVAKCLGRQPRVYVLRDSSAVREW